MEHCERDAGLPTCKDVDAAPISKPRDWATRAVDVDRAIKSK